MADKVPIYSRELEKGSCKSQSLMLAEMSVYFLRILQFSVENPHAFLVAFELFNI